MKKDTHSITAKVETITPDIAAQYLECNKQNRRLKNQAVRAYAREMKAGLWAVNGETIIFDWNGNLLNGQNRLTACIQAQVPFEALVVRGVAPQAIETLDNGVNRTVADIIQMRGGKYGMRIQGAVRMLLGIKWKTGASLKIGNAEVMKFLKRHPEMNDAAARVDEAAKVLTASVITPWYFLARYHSGHPRAAERAIKVLETGTPSYSGDPIHAFRERMLRLAAQGYLNMGGSQRAGYLYTLMHCWNEFVKKEPISHVVMRKSSVEMDDVDIDKL